MKVKIKHLALGISVAVVLLCVFAGVDNATSGDYFSAYPKQFVRLSPNLGSISDQLTCNYPDISVSNGCGEPSRCVNVRNLSILPTLQHVSTELPPYFNFHPKNIESIDAPIFMGQNDIGTRGKSFNTNSNPIDVENKACVHINKMYAVGTLEDYLVTGNYHTHHWFGVNVENMYDTTHLNITPPTNVSMISPNILYFWEEYLSYNTSDTGYWQYPNIIHEDEEHSIAGIRVPDENAVFNFEIGRSINETFYSNDYRNGSFSVIFHNLTGVSWIPCRIGAYNTSEVSVTLLHHTFTSNVPLEDIENGSNYIDFTLDKSAVQEGEQYNFSIQYYVELHSPPAIIFKPEFAVHYETGDYGPYEYSRDGSSIYLNSSYCPNPLQAVVVNVTQDLSWYRAKHLHYEEHLYEVSGLVGPHAQFSLDKNFGVGTQDDSMASGTYDSSLGYHMDIYNEDDGSDTVLGNITFSIQPENNITGVDWGVYAKWNESYAEWEFPPEFIIEENEGFGTGLGTSYSEPKYFNLNIARWFNQTSFNETAYQLVNFSVEFEDKNFEWLWGNINANEHEEVYASIVPGTFSYEAPLDGFEEWDHGIHFDFDKDEIETGVTYNFSVVVKVEPTMPVMYKPDITIGEGLYSNSTAGETGYTAEMPSYMLPEKVSHASVSTNVSNAWNFGRCNHLIAWLGEVVELVGPHAEFHFNKDFNVWTEDDAITSGIHESGKWYGVHIENIGDTSGDALGNLSFSAAADNITDVDWEEYAEWNESYVEWNFPAYPEFTIDEYDGFGTGFSRGSEIRDVNVSLSRWMNITEFNSSGYQLAKFNITFDDTNFEWVWARIEANDHHEIEASIVPGTFTYDAPLNDFDEWEHGIHFNFDKEQIETGVPYNFSIIVKVEPTGNAASPILYKPEFRIGEGLYYNSTTGTGHKIEIPSEMLPEHVYNASASTNVSNAWLIKRHNHIIAGLEEVVELPGPHAKFEFNRDFNVRTEDDTITSGTYERKIKYGMGIQNEEDDSDTVLGNLGFHAQADNITDVDWEEYAEWNESHVEWCFPSHFVIHEHDWHWTGFKTNHSETMFLNVNTTRWMNQTIFNNSGYQLAKFNVTFEDKSFKWVWARIEANDHHAIDASVVPGTFTYDAPLNDFDEWDHGIHLNFDKERIEPGVTYNFSVLIRLDLTGEEAPPILYKPQFSIGEGIYYNSTTGTGHEIEIPVEMLPDNVSYASASTNVSNAWLIKRHNHIIAGLEEVVELPGPHALFSASKTFPVVTENDTIHSGVYERNMRCGLNMKNSNDTSDTVLGCLRFNARTDNITYVNWEEHAVWNETTVSWNFPPDFVIYEDDWFGTGFGTNHTEVRHLNIEVSRQMNQTLFNDSAYQLANFTVTFGDTYFQWCGGRIEANEHYEVNASTVPGTFYTDAPLDWVNEWEHGVGFGFNRDAIETGVAYNFSVVVEVDLTGNRDPPIAYKPQFFINMELEHSFAPEGEGFTAEMLPEMLPSYVNNASVTTNISNNWTLRRVNRTIARLNEVYGSTRIEAVLYNGYINSLPAMPNVTSSTGIHDNYKFAGVGLANPTSASILSPSISLKTKEPIIDYNVESEGVKEFSYEYVAENASKLNWSLYDVPPHIQQHEGYGSFVIMGEMEPKDQGFNASVSVDKFEFFTTSEQNLNVTIDVYDNSSMEILFFETYMPDLDFVSADFVNWTSDVPPEYFEPWHANWWIENPEERRYTFSIKVNVTPYSPCVYRPGVDVFNWDKEETLVNSSSEVVESTLAGNCTISIGETRDWRVIKNVLSVTEFPSIAVENYTTISGYVKDDNGKPIGNTLVFVNLWNESEYQDYVETSTNESGYYEAYVKSGEKYEIIAGWMRPDYMTEEIEDVTITQPHIQNFTLHNASVVCGGVFDIGKNPMQGVNVMLVNESKEDISSDFTNEDGYYRQLKIPEHGNYTVKVEGYDSNELELSDVGKGKALLHNFVVEMASISGRVCEADGITPIECATVEAIPVEGGEWRETKTASDGNYTITGLPTGKYKVRVFKSGYAREYYDNVFPSHEAAIIEVTAPNETSSINFNLTEGGSISGHIYQSDGVTPISGARVFVRPSKYGFDDGFYATTNSTGYYWVDCLSLGNYRVTAEASGYAMLKYYDGVYGWDSATDVKVTPPYSTPDIDINLDLAGSISGFVYASDGTTSIPNVGLVADTTTGSFEGICAMSNDDGSYIIGGLPPGNYTVRTGEDMPNWYAGEFYDSKYTWGTADKVTVTAGNDTSNINFALDEGGWVTGHVFDEETGNPISGIQLGASMPDGDGVTPAPLTAYDGNYKFVLRNGSYLIKAGIGVAHAHGYKYVPEWYNDSYDMANATLINVTLHNETSGIDFYLAKAGSISGYVYSEEGNPISDANVYAFSDIYPGSGANTQSDGNYIIEGLPSMNYTVQVMVSGYVSEYYDDVTDPELATEVMVNAPDDTPDINFTLKKIEEYKGFDTGSGTYPSIMGTHNGTITPSYNISVSTLYTYFCAGTGGHTEYIKLYDDGTLIANGTWKGYKGDWHNITITPSVTLLKNHEYRYTIKTGSYPQIIHEHEYENATGGTITCTSFVDANGKTYTDWIPAIRLE